VIKLLPDLETLGQEIIMIFRSGNSLSEEDMAKIQAFTDQLVARGRVLEAQILGDAAQPKSNETG
jgi:hypothetical protein